MPKISVVIPICNAEKYLEQCIESVLKQTLTDIEVICVDDGSVDRSLNIIEGFAKADHRVKIITKENSGYGNSVNLGMQHAIGQYIGIVESDDFVSPKMYECLWNLCEKGTVDIVKGNFWDYYDSKDTENTDPVDVVNTERRGMPDIDVPFTIRQYPDILRGHPSVWTCIYRRKFLLDNQIRFKEEPRGGWVDNPFFFETLCCAKKIKWTKEPLYYYRKTNMNSSNNQSDLTIPLKRMMESLEILTKYHYNDEVILGLAYERALMYLRGVMKEKYYVKQMDSVRFYAQKLMRQINTKTICENFHLADQAIYNKFRSPLKMLMPTNGKILIYNWIQFDNPEKIGGGVNIYCFNLIEAILHERPDIQVFFLSSGWAYDLSTTNCFIRRTDNVFGDRCQTFEIVNSPVPSAQNLVLNNPQIALENHVIKNIFSDFLNFYGPFQAVHFNNIEGISLDVLDLKKNQPDTQFIYSIHNYIPFCITGSYYQRHRKCNCNPRHVAKDCFQCTEVGRRHNISNELLARAERVTPVAKRMQGKDWLRILKFDTLDQAGDQNVLTEFSERAIAALNRSMDHILAVSKRVENIALNNGIEPQKLKVSYIGTRIAENQVQCSVAPRMPYFKIAYLGSDFFYEEKGYAFLMKTLTSLREEDAARINLMLTTTNGNPKKIKKKLNKFHSVKVVKGYTHADLKHLLRDVHLGVIPVLWEDNLPQIAIEMVAMGVPVLSSSFGGASELCDSELFCFQGGDMDDFTKHILAFVNDPSLLNEYWNHHPGLTTMATHWKQLEPLFQIPPASSSTLISLEQYSLLLEENDFLYDHIESNKYQSELIGIRKSVSYRVGRFITYIPRKLRGLIRCYHENGMKYTLHRVWLHILFEA